jgi:hypothetical protein
MTAHVEDKLLCMKENLIKISRNHRMMKSRNDDEVIDFANLAGVEIRMEYLNTNGSSQVYSRSLCVLNPRSSFRPAKDASTHYAGATEQPSSHE